MNEIRDCVNAVYQRQQRQWMWRCASTGLVVSGVVACGLAIARSVQFSEITWVHLTGVLVAGPVLGWLYSAVWSCRERDAAAAIDQRYHLKDRAATALRFLETPIGHTVWQKLQLEDAKRHLSKVEPQAVAPIRTPRSWVWGLGVSAVAVAIAFFGAPAEQAVAEVVTNDVVAAQANTVEDSLEELEEFAADDLDPELEELLKELAERLEELKQPGVDPREALAKLSEMESALQEKQMQLESPDTEAQLADIGEALSLSEEMQAAGDAMTKGQLDKAAEELAKLDMPELDRQTEKAITEKLNEIQQNEGSGANRKLKEAAAQTAAGLSKGNRSKFQEGMEGLAGECKKQGRRKKLSDLLKKQCRCLSECKGECESECRNTGSGNKKGGNNWGLAKSDNEPGDKTARLKSDNKMDIKGQESAGGDIDVETMTGPETAQEAVRRYRSQSEKYEQLTESVLDSEPIPLGHRQTIRRYFEMIRPQAGEVDAVNEQTQTAE